VLSEFPLGTPPESGNFPRRNRLISGLARGVVVVEASLRSGSLITAKCALDQNRDVFAVPGSVHTELSRGCHALLREGAFLVECAADVLRHYKLTPHGAATAMPVEREPADPVLRAMGTAPVGVDELVKLTGLAAAEVAARLAGFEIEGRVTGIAGGRYQRRPGAAEHAL
jgi:DNA processing protein